MLAPLLPDLCHVLNAIKHTGKVWFITGSVRGLGRSLTEAVLARGGRVAATARQPEQLAPLVAQYSR